MRRDVISTASSTLREVRVARPITDNAGDGEPFRERGRLSATEALGAL